MASRRLTSHNIAAPAETYSGTAGDLFYDPRSTTLRISDGVTQGGQIIGSGGGGGGASTGDITFDGVKMIGAGTAGLYSTATIDLVPDINAYNDSSGRYITLDATVPNHIHLRAGGAVDGSNALLLLGGEKTNVNVSDGDGSVSLWTTDPQSQQLYTTSMDRFGNVVFPNTLVMSTGTPLLSSNASLYLGTNMSNSLFLWALGDDGTTSFPGRLQFAYQAPANTIDVTSTVQILGNSSYSLPDGREGQIMILVPAGAGTNDAVLVIDNARYSNNANIVNASAFSWKPFSNTDTVTASSACVLLMFINGLWNLPHGYVPT